MKNGKQRITATAAALAAIACLAGTALWSGPQAAAEDNAGGAGYVQSFDFTKATDFSDLGMFSAGIDPATNSEALGYTSDSWVTYERGLDELFSLDNGLKVNTDKYSGDDVSENNLYVRYNAKQLQYFTAELVYSYDDTARNGWAGFMFGYTNFARKARWGDSPAGVEMFVQREGKGTYSSAKLNDSSYTEGIVPEGWTAVGEHTLRITATAGGVTLNADGTDVISFDSAFMAEKGYALASANIGFYLTNAAFTVKSFAYSPLNAAGDTYVAAESIEITALAEATQFEAVEVQASVLPAEATVKTVGYELPAGAIANGNKLCFAAPGDYTITAYSVDNPALREEFTVKVKAAENYVRYGTTAEDAEKNFDNYFVTNGGSKDGTAFPVGDYWSFGVDGSMTLKEKKKSGVDAGYVLLYLKDLVNGLPVESNCFELDYMVKTETSAPNGWHGVGFALSDRSTVPNQDGISAFIQEEALKATIWGSGKGGVGGPSEYSSAYVRGTWNFVRLKVYGAEEFRIEMYVNDMETPAVSATGTNLPAAGVALFTTTIVTLDNIYFAELDANGNAIGVVYPQTVTIKNDFSGVTVGDKVQLETEVLPADTTDASLLYGSSDALVATVNGDGLVTFLNAGKTTLTVKCKSNPEVKAEIEVTVKEKEVLPESVSFDATPKEAVVGGKYTLLVTVGPENATNYNVRFMSSDESVATVDDEGRLSYVGEGETVITVVCEADESVKASFTLTVKAAPGSDSSGTGSVGQGSSGGCGSVAGGTAGVTALFGSLFVMLRKKRK